jgi:hypothetical protein
VFLAESCLGGEMAQENTEESVKMEETMDCFAFSCISLHTLLYTRMVFGIKTVNSGFPSCISDVVSPEFEAKLNINLLLLQISHYKTHTTINTDHNKHC